MSIKHIGFVGTRFAGTDGVSLETAKWAEVFEGDGHECFYLAGQLDTPESCSMLLPECFFEHPEILETTHGTFGCRTRDPKITLQIEALKHRIKAGLHEFVERFAIDVLIPENALTIPLNLPLGLAITEFAIETGIPVIAHHHDFFWERKRFIDNACWDYLDKAFPPHFQSIHHCVLNSSQQHQLSRRRGVAATIVPNVMHYADPPPRYNGYADDLREDLGLAPGEKFILQPTRIVQRKGIEHALELVKRLGVPAKLVISHASGDEGYSYYGRICEYAERVGVDMIQCSDTVGEERGLTADGKKIYTLEDMYHKADFVTYPSVNEGFGNAFLEAIYYRRPIMVNLYSIYAYDIKPKGFRTVEIDGYVSDDAVSAVREIIENPELASEMADHNYALAHQFFSFEVLRKKLRAIMGNCFGYDGSTGWGPGV